jgi:hypothetical protein
VIQSAILQASMYLVRASEWCLHNRERVPCGAHGFNVDAVAGCARCRSSRRRSQAPACAIRVEFECRPAGRWSLDLAGQPTQMFRDRIGGIL